MPTAIRTRATPVAPTMALMSGAGECTHEAYIYTTYVWSSSIDRWNDGLSLAGSLVSFRSAAQQAQPLSRTLARGTPTATTTPTSHATRPCCATRPGGFPSTTLEVLCRVLSATPTSHLMPWSGCRLRCKIFTGIYRRIASPTLATLCSETRGTAPSSTNGLSFLL